MLRKYSYCVLALLIVIGLGGSALAQHGRWQFLGSSHVDGNSDHDKINVNNGQTCRAIQLRVSGSAIQFDKVVVRYGNGTQQELALHNKIPAGGQSRSIDLPGAQRAIDRVELWYEKASWGSKPEVQLYGMH